MANTKKSSSKARKSNYSLLVRRRAGLSYRLLVTVIAVSAIAGLGAVYASRADSSNLQPSADTWVGSVSPDQNNGTIDPIHFNDSERRALIKFATAGSVPAGDTLNGATLKLFITKIGTNNGGIQIHPESNSWNESTVTWNNQPSWNSSVTATSAAPQLNTWVTIKLPASAINLNSDTSFGITASQSADGVAFSSREDQTNPPELSLNFSGGGSTPTPSVSGPPTPPPTHTPTPPITPTPTPGGPGPNGPPGSWKMVFDDEFNGSSLDSNMWANSWFGGGSMNNVKTSPANVSVSGGHLILTLSSSSTGALVDTDPHQAKSGFQFGDGYYAEAKVDFPGHGSTIDNWPAFWTDGQSWPKDGEIDIAEGLGNLTSNYHSSSGANNSGNIPGTWSNGWHTYGVDRETGKNTIWWDGNVVRTYSTNDGGSPHYLIFNVGDGEGPTVTGAGSQVQVDYVRVWQYQGKGSPSPTPTPTAPLPPTNLQTTSVNPTSVGLSWTAPTGGPAIANYIVLRDGNVIGQVPSSTTSYNDQTALPSSSYSYNVESVDASGNDSQPSNTLQVKTPSVPDTQPPTAPTNLKAQAVGPNQINLTWTASTDNVGVAGYYIFVNGTNTWTVNGNSTSFGAGSLNPSTTYNFFAQAFDAAGNVSGDSNAVAATTPAGGDPHVMVLMMENESTQDILGNSQAPYENSLVNQYQSYTNYYGIGHYSLDNYLGLFSGNFYSWSENDCTPGSGCQVNTPTVGTQLDSAGIPWVDVNESMPQNCDKSNATDYGVRHNPTPYFTNMSSDCGQKDIPATNLTTMLNSSSPPDFIFFSPNLCHDGGQDQSCGSIANGDKFLATEIPALQATTWYKSGGVIDLSYDEGDGNNVGEQLTGAGNHVINIVISDATAGKPSIAAYTNHFGLLGGIEQAYGLQCLGQACVSGSGQVSIP